MKASIIIPTKDKLPRLSLVLKTLEPQINNAIEVIVIFDGCSQETVRGFNEIKLKYKPIPIIHTQNLGRARARNSGIRHAKGDIVIFLDDDRLPTPDFVLQHIEKHVSGHYAVIGERLNINYSDEELRGLCRNGVTYPDFLEMSKRAFKEPNDRLKKIGRRILGQLLETVTFTTGNSSVRRKDLLNIGLFDENFFGWGMEDVDLGYRLAKSGVKIIRDYSIINYHLVHPVSKLTQKEEYTKNFNYFINKIENDRKAIYMAKLLNTFM